MKMKKNHIVLIAIGLILAVAVLTNPSHDRHREAIKLKLNTYWQKSMSEAFLESSNEWELVGQTLGLMLGGALIDGIISNIVTTDNYLIFSTTKMTWAGETNIIGIGVFGNVYLTKEIDEALDKGLLSE